MDEFSHTNQRLLADSETELSEWVIPQQVFMRRLTMTADHDAIAKFLSAPPSQVVDSYRRALTRVNEQNWAGAIAEFEAAQKQFPKSADICNAFAWLLAVCPDPQFRNPSRAVDVAERAVLFDPANFNYWNTLGVAQYRDRQWRKAIESLTKAEEMAPGKLLGENGLFLAMAHWNLDEPQTGRAWLKKSIEWLEKNRETINRSPQYAEELARFRVEAEELVKPE